MSAKEIPMDFKGYLGKGWAIVKLDRDTAAEVAADENSFGPAVLFFAIGGLAGGLGGAAFSGGLTLIMAPIFAVIWSFVSVGILHLLAGLFGGTGNFKGYYSAMGIGSLPQWAGLIPFLGSIIALWYIPVAVIVTERVHGINQGKAIAVVLLPLIALFIIIMVLIAIIGTAAFMGLMHQGGMH